MVEHQTFNLGYLSSTLSEYTYPSEASLNSDIDAQIEDNRGYLIGEHKTHKRFPDGDVRMFNTQSSLYAWVCNEHLGFKADRILWNYIRADVPSVPKGW